MFGEKLPIIFTPPLPQRFRCGTISPEEFRSPFTMKPGGCYACAWKSIRDGCGVYGAASNGAGWNLLRQKLYSSPSWTWVLRGTLHLGQSGVMDCTLSLSCPPHKGQIMYRMFISFPQYWHFFVSVISPHPVIIYFNAVYFTSVLYKLPLFLYYHETITFDTYLKCDWL